MLNIYTVAFLGHRYIENIYDVENLLDEQIRKLICSHEYVEFLVGRNGDFDRYVSSVVRKVQENFMDGNSSLTLLLPYLTAEYLNNQDNFEKYYSDIEISQKAATAHPKAAITIRNKEMVDRADLVICYVTQNFGGAYGAMKYAKRQNKEIINLAEILY